MKRFAYFGVGVLGGVSLTFLSALLVNGLVNGFE